MMPGRSIDYSIINGKRYYRYNTSDIVLPTGVILKFQAFILKLGQRVLFDKILSTAKRTKRSYVAKIVCFFKTFSFSFFEIPGVEQ